MDRYHGDLTMIIRVAFSQNARQGRQIRNATVPSIEGYTVPAPYSKI